MLPFKSSSGFPEKRGTIRLEVNKEVLKRRLYEKIVRGKAKN